MPRPRHTKDVKIVPTATLFGVDHIRVRVGAVITSHIRTSRAWVEESIWLVALGYRTVKCLVFDICQSTLSIQ